MIKKISATFISVLGLALFTVPAFAHVIVYPHQVGIAAMQDFTVSVPNERDNPVVSVRLLIPNSLSSVSPNAISGWTINIKSKGSGDNASVSEIDWTNGTIPVGQRQEFIFQAQVPAQASTLNWKAYQTYSDGTVVSWDVKPSAVLNLSDSQQDALAAKQNKGEYSTTQVINDLAYSPDKLLNSIANLSNQVHNEGYFSDAAVVLSLIAVALTFRKK